MCQPHLLQRSLLGFALAISSVMLAGTASASASTGPAISTWGTWVPNNPSDAILGNITFENPDAIGASFTFVVDAGYHTDASVISIAQRGTWLTSESPAGNEFGTSVLPLGNDALFLRTTGILESRIVFDFDVPIPYGNIGLVVQEVDHSNDAGYVDEANMVTIFGTDENGNPISATDLNASAFNFCNVTVPAQLPTACAGNVRLSTPILTFPTPNTAFFFGSNGFDSGIGNSAWVNPHVAVKSLTVAWVSSQIGSDISVQLAQKSSSVSTNSFTMLPDTGATTATGLLSSLILAAIGGVALMVTIRRRVK